MGEDRGNSQTGKVSDTNALEHIEKGRSFYSAKNHVEAAACFRCAADMGNSMAIHFLGMLHYYGEGVEKDYLSSARLFTRAAEMGESDAQIMLALQYLDGEGVEKDWRKAAHWLLCASEAENDLSVPHLLKVAKLLNDSPDMKKDGDEEIVRRISQELYRWGEIHYQKNENTANCFRESAKLGHAVSVYNLGVCYYNGTGVTKNLKKSAGLIRLAKKRGYEGAVGALPVVLCEAGIDAYERQSYEDAFNFLEEAAGLGDTDAMAKLAVMYQPMVTRRQYWRLSDAGL